MSTKKEVNGGVSGQGVTSTNTIKQNNSLNGYFIDLYTYLDENFPGCMLMPTKECGKIPLFKHKDGLWTSQDFMKRGLSKAKHGCVIILSTELIVVDVDDANYVTRLEEQFPELQHTVACKTAKGMHYYFRRTPECDAMGLTDGARQLKDSEGNALPIDIKTKTTKGTGGVISIPPSPNKAWARALGHHPILDMSTSLLSFFKAHMPHNSTLSRNITTIQSTVNIELDEVKKIVTKCLDKRRASNYEDWIKLGWCLHNISAKDLLDTWDEFSQQSYKYKTGECERQWSNMRDQGLHIGTLHMWAKHDNAYEYKQIINTRVYNDVKTCNGSHNALAAIAAKLLKGRYVCAIPNGKLWYEFNGSLWTEDPEAIHLRHELSTTVREQFIIVMSKIQNTATLDDMQSTGSSNTTMNDIRTLCEKLLHISFKLQDAGFKDSVVKEMREYMYDRTFLKKLDANPNLIAFTNGVWELQEGRFRNAKPEDFVSLSVGYDYIPKTDEQVQDTVRRYWTSLHPVPDQCVYVVKTIARQLYGDHGNELFHIHAGFQGSASNGKTKFFEIMESCLGDYVRKFGVEHLTAKQRPDPGKPMPEFQHWRGRRFLYCTEPNHDDVINTGIMKDFTGGEKVLYRLLFSNDIHEFRPQYKMHMMCNDAPKVDGSDQGVQRRGRKVDYVAKFVDASDVDPSQHKYMRDDRLINGFRSDHVMKMEFLRILLEQYDHHYEFTMPDVIRENSMMYLEENNAVVQFMHNCVKTEVQSLFTLKEAKELFKRSDYYNGKLLTKNDIERYLRRKCTLEKRVNGKKYTNVFEGYTLIDGYVVSEDES